MPSLEVLSCRSKFKAIRLRREKFWAACFCRLRSRSSETDIQSPMQFVFDAPVLAYRSVQLDGIRRETGDVIAGLWFRDPGSFVIALSLNPYQPAQAGPFLRLFQQT